MNKDIIDLSDSFIVNDKLSLADAPCPSSSFPAEDGDVGALNLGGTSVASEQLVREQKGEAELSSLFDNAVVAEEKVFVPWDTLFKTWWCLMDTTLRVTG